MKRKEQLEQLTGMSTEELKDQADALKESLFRLKFRKTLGVGETVNDIRREKKTLARVYTLLNKKDVKEEAPKA
ncbi:MAG: 50S ribosomal protein L29 [Chloracidobacterium sp.]|nr:50S ribosomal protein L29 [Chloracidobacterium sp.]